MILGQSLKRLIDKLDSYEGDPGAIGGEGGNLGGSGGSGGNAGSSDAGPLGGQGTLSGILSGRDMAEAIADIAAVESNNAAIAAALAAGASPVASGDPTSAGFGGTAVGGSLGEGNQSPGQSGLLGKQIGQAVLNGSMTVSAANAALASIAGQNTGLAGLLGGFAANTAAINASIPNELGFAFSAMSPVPVSAFAGLAGAFSAISGQDALGASPDADVSGGPDSKSLASGSEVSKVLADMNIGGTDVANTTDILSQLKAELGTGAGFGSEDNISFNVGNQEVSIMPKAKRDELALLLEYMRIKEGQSQFSQQLGFEQRQAEPSFVDKSSQLIGLGSDAIGLWSGISSMFG